MKLDYVGGMYRMINIVNASFLRVWKPHDPSTTCIVYPHVYIYCNRLIAEFDEINLSVFISQC